jgi:glycosyltransferase involved in cell wall biosynthesis
MPSRFALERHRADGLDAPMTVLPNFVPAPAEQTNTESPQPRPFFLFVGRLEKLKGVQDLIQLFADYREADLVILGDGGYRAELEARASELEHVKFLGAVHPSELGSYYRHAVAVLVPSLCYEVFPLIPAEALSYGTPVIGRRLGALTEVVEESGGGLLFDTIAECRTAMEKLRTDPQLRQNLGQKGQQTALARWTTDVHLERYLEIVRSQLERKTPRGDRPA